MHGIQSAALDRLSKMNVAAQVASSSSPPPSSSTHPPTTLSSTYTSSSNNSLPHTTSLANSSGFARATPILDRTDAAYPTAPIRHGGSDADHQGLSSTPSSVVAHNPSASQSSSSLSEIEGYSNFFDDYFTSEASPSDTTRTESDVPNSEYQPLQLDFISGNARHRDAIDDEDLKDLSAFKFPRSFSMKFEPSDGRGAASYAYNAEGYSDPNGEYGPKAVVAETHDATSIEESYAQLISRLSFAQDGASYQEARGRNHQRSYEQSPEHREELTPKTSSTKDSPFTASLASRRSSSDAHEDELRTPPEPFFDGFEQSVDAARYESVRGASLPFIEQSPRPAQGTAAPPVHLGSPFQPLQAQSQPSWQPGHLVDTQALFRRFDIGDSSELELLSDDVNEQRSAAGKARRLSPPSELSDSPSASGHGHDTRSSSTHAVIDSSKPFTRLGPRDVVFSASTLPERKLSADDCIDIVVSRYPSMCDAPAREFGEDGQPLPPTKKQETSDDERKARRDALRVKFCAKQRLSLIKAMIVMESRSASWKRIGPANPNGKTVQKSTQQPNTPSPNSSGEVGRLPPMPSPWSMEVRHEQLDVAQIKGKSKKTIELAALRTNAQCIKCEGSGLGACPTCKAEQADECFWCNGTGREKTRAQASCRRCQGAGVLKCNTCHGSLKSNCRSCEGTGTGEYGFFVDITVKRVEMPAVPISTLFPQFDPASTAHEPSYEEVKAAATLAVWDSINKLTEARSQAVATKGSKAKSKEMVPVMAACTWENSITHVVAVDIPLAAKFKKGATPELRPEGLQRKIATQRRFFTVPSDADLRSVELTEEEVKKLGAPRSNSPYNYQRASNASSSAVHSPSPLASYNSSPALSTVDFGGRPPLASPEQGGSISGYSTPSRVPSPRAEVSPSKPAAKEFVHRPSPLSQLAAATPAASQLVLVQDDTVEQSYFNGQHEFYSPPQPRYTQAGSRDMRRPSAGNILSKKLSSNLLSKIGAHRGSV